MTPAEALADTQTQWGSSRFATYQDCQRKHHLRYVTKLQLRRNVDLALDWEPDEPLWFEVGSLCHGVLRYVQEPVMHEPDILVASWPDVIQYARDSGNYEDASCDETSRLMSAYWHRWGLENGGWPPESRIVGVEMLLESQVGGMPCTARADTILVIGDQRFVVDTKTRSRNVPKGRERFARSLSTHPQFCRLAWLDGGLTDPTPIIHNAIVKTKIPAFDRLPVRPSVTTVALWLDSQEAMAASGLRGAAPNLGACHVEIGDKGRCEYFDWCHGTETQRERYYEKKE